MTCMTPGFPYFTKNLNIDSHPLLAKHDELTLDKGKKKNPIPKEKKKEEKKSAPVSYGNPFAYEINFVLARLLLVSRGQGEKMQ